MQGFLMFSLLLLLFLSGCATYAGNLEDRTYGGYDDMNCRVIMSDPWAGPSSKLPSACQRINRPH
jgi:hypothetical protein